MRKNQCGMTLVEVLFATAIFSFVAITLFALFKLGQSYWARGMAYNLIQNELKKTSTLLEKYLKQTDIRFVQTIRIMITPARYAIIFPIQNEQGNIEYMAFIATNDQVAPDRSGFLYFVTFRTTDTNPTLADLAIGTTRINENSPVSRQNINSITLLPNRVNSRSRNIVLLSNNVSVFEARTNQQDRTVTIKMIFLKRVAGENTIQSVGASMFVTTMNSFL